MMTVRSCSFHTLDGKAVLVDEDGNEEVVGMRDIVLFQYTGACDKDGVKVYEGDIAIVDAQNIYGSVERLVGEVIYDTNAMAYTILPSQVKKVNPALPLTGFFVIHKVLGNSIENPELLVAPNQNEKQTGGKAEQKKS